MKLKHEVKNIFLKNMVVSSGYQFENVNDYYSFLVKNKPLVLKNNHVHDNVCDHRFNLVHPIGYGNKDWKCPYHNSDQSHLKKYNTFKYNDIFFIGDKLYESSIKELFNKQKLNLSKCIYTKTHDINANWKLIIENAIESYHVPFVHEDIPEPFLTKDRYPKSYRVGIHSYDYITLKTTRFKKYFDEWYWRNYFIWPNAWLSQSGHYVLLAIILPISYKKSKVSFELFVQDNDWHPKILKYVNGTTTDVVKKLFKQDIPFIESCQIGLESNTHKKYNLSDNEPRVKWFYETYSEYKYKLDNKI